MKKIIVPFDYSDEASYALDFAVQLAKKMKYPITVLNIIAFPVVGAIDSVGMLVPPIDDPKYLNDLQTTGEQELKDHLSEAGYIDSVEFKVEFGTVYNNISEDIHEDDGDIIIMGTKGASGAREFLVGSNTEKVVRSARCPVMAIHQRTMLDDLKDIVFATDGETITADLIENLKKLQKILGAHLHIVRVNTPNHFERDRSIKPLLNKLVEDFSLKNYTLHIYNDTYEHQGIMDFAEDIDAGLIALATHGRKGLGHFLSGSLAEDLVNHSKRIVWTYKIKPEYSVSS